MVTLPRLSASAASAVSSLHGCARRQWLPRTPSPRPPRHGSALRHRPAAPLRAACPEASAPRPTAARPDRPARAHSLAARNQRMHAECFGLDALAGRLAPQVPRRIERHGVEPGGEGAAAAIGADRPAEPTQTSCAMSSASARLPAPAPGDAIDKVVVPFDQPAESIPVAVARPPDQIRIGGGFVSPASSPSFAC